MGQSNGSPCLSSDHNWQTQVGSKIAVLMMEAREKGATGFRIFSQDGKKSACGTPSFAWPRSVLRGSHHTHRCALLYLFLRTNFGTYGMRADGVTTVQMIRGWDGRNDGNGNIDRIGREWRLDGFVGRLVPGAFGWAAIFRVLVPCRVPGEEQEESGIRGYPSYPP